MLDFTGQRFKQLTILRALRPLKSINNLKKMRLVVNSLLYSLTALFNVTIFLLFMFSLYGIMGLQMF